MKNTCTKVNTVYSLLLRILEKEGYKIKQREKIDTCDNALGIFNTIKNIIFLRENCTDDEKVKILLGLLYCKAEDENLAPEQQKIIYYIPENYHTRDVLLNNAIDFIKSLLDGFLKEGAE